MEGNSLATPTAPLSDGTVLLRLPQDHDGAAIWRYGQDPDIEETRWLPIPCPCPGDTATRTVREFQQGWQGRFGLILVITTPPATELLGVVHLFVHEPRVGELAYGVAP